MNKFSITIFSLFLIFVCVYLIRCKATEQKKPQLNDNKISETFDSSDSKESATRLKSCFQKKWGPITISSESANVSGISSATGVGQIGVTWIETGQVGADVYFARLTTETVTQKIKITRNASAYPPTATAWTGRDFALAWGDDRFKRIEIFVGKVSPEGNITLEPRQLTKTRSRIVTGIPGEGADSSQEPSLAYYGNNLLIIWSGPGEYGTKQVYQTELSARGTPLHEPKQLTGGHFDHFGLNLFPIGERVSFYFCVNRGEFNEMFRGIISGKIPQITSEPSPVSETEYPSCEIVETEIPGQSLVLWPEKIKEGDKKESNILKIARSMLSGEFDRGNRVEGINLVPFPGKNKKAFDAKSVDGNVAIAWIEKSGNEERNIKAGIFGKDGKQLCQPLNVDSEMVASDPHIVYSGFEKNFIVLWTDKKFGGNFFTLKAEGIEVQM